MTDRPVDDGSLLPEGDLTVDPATADAGPEATAEQDALVAGLLASLRADDPPMPDDVVRRLDAVLAEERRARLEAAGVTSLPVGAAAAAAAVGLEDEAAGSAPAPVTVLPDRADRRGPGTRSFKILGGAAAAVALVATGAFIGTQGLGGSSSGSSSGGAPVVAAAGVPVADTATTYSQSALEQQARDLVGSLRLNKNYAVITPQAAPPDSPQTDTAATEGAESPEPGSTQAYTDDGVVTGEELAGCLQEITGSAAATPLVVDQGTYEGKPAEVIVLPSSDQQGAVDVWVVSAGCRAGAVELLDFRRLALGTATPTP